MTAVLQGFATIWLVIAAGFVLAHARVLDARSQLLMARLSFFVASPPLLLLIMSRADLGRLFNEGLVVTVAAIVVAGLLWVVLARTVFGRNAGDTVIGTFASCYVNAGNLGLPIALYVLGDVTWMAPILLVQVALLQPAGLTALDLAADRAVPSSTPAPRHAWRSLTLPLRNPMSVATVLGLALNVADIEIPALLLGPLEMVAAMAVPTMLLAFGVSLRTGPLPGRGERPAQVWTIVALKLLLQPAVAWLLGMLLGLPAEELLACVVIAALPTAQNVFTHAIRYDRAVLLARDVIFITTIGSIPILIAIVALLR